MTPVPLHGLVAVPPPIALIVGMQAAVVTTYRSRLRNAGYQVACAAHGPAACALTRELRPSLVVVSRNLWALERNAIDVAAATVAADVIDDAALERLFRR